jgi:hypothetical protein
LGKASHLDTGAALGHERAHRFQPAWTDKEDVKALHRSDQIQQGTRWIIGRAAPYSSPFGNGLNRLAEHRRIVPAFCMMNAVWLLI